jgi:hypothetical protein
MTCYVTSDLFRNVSIVFTPIDKGTLSRLEVRICWAQGREETTSDSGISEVAKPK